MKQLTIKECPTFVETFCHLMSDSEVPFRFSYWSALGFIGSLMGKDVTLEHAFGNIYLNLYLFLFGPSGAKKNTAIDRLIDRLPLTSKILLVSGEITWPGIIDKVYNNLLPNDECMPTLIHASEMSMNWKGKDVADRIMRSLTQYEGGPRYFQDTTRMWGDKSHAMYPCFNAAGASTIKWLRGIMSEDSLTEGWGARFIPIIGEWDFTQIVANPGRRITNKEELWDYIDQLTERFLAVRGDIWFTQEAENFDEMTYNTMPIPKSSLEGTLRNRRQAIWRKLSGILAINRNFGLGEIIVEDLKQGIELCYEREGYIRQLYASLGTRDRFNFIDIVLEFVKERECASQRELRQRFARRMTKPELETAIETLLDEGELIYTTGKKGGRIYAPVLNAVEQ